jgi:hypothetical protein
MLLSPDHIMPAAYSWYVTITSIWWSYMFPAVMGFHGMLGFVIELLTIWPSVPGLHLVSSIYKSQNQNPASRNIHVKPMVDFTRMNIGRFDKLSCDWCSIVNGTCEYAINTIIDEIEHGGVDGVMNMRLPRTATWTIYYANTMLMYLPGSASYLHRWKHGETLEMSPGYIAIHSTLVSKHVQNIEDIMEHLRPFTTFAYFAEAQERRWCPFKQMVNGRTKPYMIYNSQYANEIKEVAGIILRHGSITCNNCNQIVNSELPHDLPIVETPLHRWWYNLIDE